MTEKTNLPNMLDATPHEGTTGDYGYQYLVDVGYFEEPTSDTVTYQPDCDVEYQFSIEGSVRIAYFEFPMSNVPQDTPKKITQELKRKTRLQYFWFFDPEMDRVQVFRASRGNFQFIYNPGLHKGTTAESKLDKLERVSEDINVLFDYKDVVDRFYQELWDHRSDLANSITTESGYSLSKKQELLSAQRIIDRTIFLYFLVERGVVIPLNDSKEMVPGKTDRIFNTLVDKHDNFWTLLQTIFFQRLNSKDSNDVKFSGSYWLHVPYLNGGLFQPEDLETADGTIITEDEELVVEDFDWEALINELNEYNWLLDGLEGTDEDEKDTVGNLTPAVLGYIYEKFVISVSKVGNDVRLSDLDPSERDDLLSEGNSEVGAYYTGEDITDFKARRALWEGLLEKIDEDIEEEETPRTLNHSDLYRAGEHQTEAIESDQKDGFDTLYEDYPSSPEVLEYLDSKLQELKVCDPAVGSGSFALAVANTLFEWRSMCRPDTDEYVLRRQIIAQNIFGVDILEGATEICKLRLWLWLISATPVDTTEGYPVDNRDETPPLPDITFNIRTGNSLIGFTHTTAVADQQHTLDSSEMEEQFRQYGEDVSEYRKSADPEKDMKRKLNKRHKELKKDLDEWYAGTQSDTNNNRLSMTDHVDDVSAAWTSLNAVPQSSTTLSINIPDGIPDKVGEYLEREGFTTYKYKARLDSPTHDKKGVTEIFDQLRQHFSSPDDWDVLVEREYAAQDFDKKELDACHWPLEFPHVFLNNGGFDVVISNPPYGASLSPKEEPLLNSESNYNCQGANDSCEWFYERALDLVHSQGVVSYIVSKSVSFYSSWSDIREKLIKETEFKHIFDVGLGFVGVNLETVAIIHTINGAPGEGTPTIHRSRNTRSTTANQPVYIGWASQNAMQESGTIILNPFTTEDEKIVSAFESCSRFKRYWRQRPFRGVYILGNDRQNIIEGGTPFIDDNPALQRYYLDSDGVRYIDLDNLTQSNQKSAKKTRHPRLLFKVLRGSRVVVYKDETGRFVSTGDIVNAPVETTDTPHTLATLYAVLNCPAVSYYVHKLVYNESTETARNLDAPYIKKIPIPTISAEQSDTLTKVADYALFLNQYSSDSGLDSEVDELAEFFARLCDAMTASLYFDLSHTGIDEVWENLGESAQTIEYNDWADERFSTEPYPEEDTEQIYRDISSSCSSIDIEQIQEVINEVEDSPVLNRISEVLDR